MQVGNGNTEVLLDQVIAVWSDVLGVKVTPSDKLFHLGSDSVQAARIAVSLSTISRRAIRVVDVMTHQQASELAEWISLQPDLPLESDVTEPPVSCYEISHPMERRLRRDAMHEDPTWRVNFGFVLTGPLEVERLRRALDHVIQRHEILRSRFFVDDAGRGMQEVLDHRPLLRIVTSHVGHQTECVGVLRGFFREPFDRSAGDVFRACLVRHSDVSWTLAFSVDHLVFDRQSMSVFLRELSHWYNSPDASDELPPPGQVREYSAWQRKLLACDDGRKMREFWREHLAGVLPATEYFAKNRCAPGVSGDDDGIADVVVSRDLDKALAARAAQFCQHEGVTPYATCLAALLLVLDVIDCRRDHVVLSPFAQRDLPHFADVIGYLAQVAAIRARWQPGISLRELLRTAASALLTTQAHSALPWSEVIRDLLPTDYLAPESRETFYLDVADVSRTKSPTLSSLNVAPLSMEAYNKKVIYRGSLGISLSIRHADDTWHATLAASGRTFDALAAASLLQTYVRALALLIRQPDRAVEEARAELLAERER